MKEEKLPEITGIFLGKDGKSYTYCDHCHQQICMDDEEGTYEETGSAGRTDQDFYFMHIKCMENYK